MTPTPESPLARKLRPPSLTEMAAQMVRFAPERRSDGAMYVLLMAPGCEPVRLGPFRSRTEARAGREEVRRFVAASIHLGMITAAWVASGRAAM